MRIESWQRNLAAVWVSQAMVMVAFSFVFPFFPLYVQTLGVHGTAAAAQWAGAIAASSAVSMAFSQPIWGNMADRWGRKPMLVRSMLGACLTTTLMGFATAPEQLLVLRLLQGTLSGTVAASNALVATSTPRNRLGFALGMLQVAQFVGASVGPLIGGVIADTLGFRTSFYGAGALMVVSVVILVVFVKEDFIPRPSSAPRPSVWAESRSILAIPLLPILISVMFLIQTGGNIVSPVLTLLIAEMSGGENAATAAGIVLAGTGVVSACSAIVLGRVSDRVGHRTVLPICLLGAALSYFPQALVQETWQLMLLRMLLGVFLGGLMPSTNALMAGLVPQERRGASFGLAGTAMALANFAGPLSGAGIATHWGLRAVFIATGVVFAVAYVWVTLSLRKLEPRGRPTPPVPKVPASPPDNTGEIPPRVAAGSIDLPAQPES